jgi:hypothetical protein
MCILCDGATEQDLFEDFRDRIAQYDFTMLSVGDESASWTYSIGLLASFGHPEFVITGLDPGSASGVITGLVDRIRRGERFTASSPDTVHAGVPFRFGEVHGSQWTHGRFAMWCAYYDRFGGAPAPLSAVQILWPNDSGVFPPDRDFCREHRNCQPLLAVAAAGNVNRGPNRAQRRKKRR